MHRKLVNAEVSHWRVEDNILVSLGFVKTSKSDAELEKIGEIIVAGDKHRIIMERLMPCHRRVLIHRNCRKAVEVQRPR